MNNHIDLNLTPEQVRQLPPAERLPYIKYIRLKYPRSEQILEAIRDCYESSVFSADPQCLLLVGPTGVGKTTLLEIVLEEHPRIVTETGMVIPVLISTIDVPATVGNFASGLLRSLGDPRYGNGTIGNRMFRVEGFTEDCGTIMLILDEIQHFVDRDSRIILQTVSDSLKNLIKKRHLACVLTGLQGEAEQVVDANPQLAGLFPDPIVLEPFVWDEVQPQKIKEFRTLLYELEKALPLAGESNLASKERAWRIYVATSGVMRFLMVLIREATYQALKRGQEFLDDALLENAFNKKLSGERRGISNPFIGPPPEYKSPEERQKHNGNR